MKLLNSTLIACAVVVAVMVASPARAGDSLLVLRSELGDWLGQGQTLAFGPGQGSLTTSSEARKGFQARFDSPGHTWFVRAARGRWNPLVPGIYGIARGFISSGDTLPTFDVSGDGRGCGDSPSYFDVRQIAYDAGGVARRLRVLFEYHCSGAVPGLTGELRIDADTTLTVNLPLHIRARRGQVLALPVSAIHAAGLPFALTAGSLPAGATFIDNGNGTGQMNWTPGIVQQGDFELAFTASDGLGKTEVAHTLVRVDGDTLLDVTSEPGDRAWLQKNCRLRPGDMRVTATGSGAAGVWFFANSPAVGNRFFYTSPNAPGNYSVLRRWSNEAFAYGSFSAATAPGGCGAVETHYRVRRSEIGPTIVTKLWVEWEQHCDGEAPAFRGEMRVNAGSPIVAYAPIARRVHYGDTLRFQVSGRDTLGRPLVLSAWGLPSGCTFTSTSSTTSEVLWRPSDAAAGPYTLMFRAINSAGEADTVATDVVVTGDVSASIVSEPGDPVGSGTRVSYNGSPGGLLTALLVSDWSLGTSDALNFYKADSAWFFKIRGPEGAAGSAIPAGRYSTPWPPVGNSVYFSGSSSFGGSGEWFTTDFRLRQMQRGGAGSPTRLWLQFEQRTDDRMPILYGDIRIDARWRVLARAPLRHAATALHALDFEVRGETPDGEVPAISSVSMPTGSSLSPTGPGRATFHWVPDETNIGVPKTVGFVATRSDGTTDTSWTVLETLPRGTMHLEESGRIWDLDSDLGQFRSQGGTSWAKATFSSPRADTIWSVDIGVAYNDTMRMQPYLMPDEYGPRLCIAVPGNSYSTCRSDTGRFEITRLMRTVAGPPSQLWVDFDEAHGMPEKRRFGWMHLGTASALAVPRGFELPASFECSQFMPNPAMHARRLELRLPNAGKVTMTVYDVSGRRIVGHDWGVLNAGQHSLQPPGLNALPAGLYLVSIEYAGQRVTRRLSVLR